MDMLAPGPYAAKHAVVKVAIGAADDARGTPSVDAAGDVVWVHTETDLAALGGSDLEPIEASPEFVGGLRDE